MGSSVKDTVKKGVKNVVKSVQADRARRKRHAEGRRQNKEELAGKRKPSGGYGPIVSAGADSTAFGYAANHGTLEGFPQDRADHPNRRPME